MPSRRNSAPSSPFGQRSASRKMRSFSAALKVRRLACTSPAAPAGASGEVLGVVVSVMVISCRPTLNYRRGVSSPILAQRDAPALVFGQHAVAQLIFNDFENGRANDGGIGL